MIVSVVEKQPLLEQVLQQPIKKFEIIIKPYSRLFFNNYSSPSEIIVEGFEAVLEVSGLRRYLYLYGPEWNRLSDDHEPRIQVEVGDDNLIKLVRVWDESDKEFEKVKFWFRVEYRGSGVRTMFDVTLKKCYEDGESGLRCEVVKQLRKVYL